MIPPARQRLPQRRPSETRAFTVHGRTVDVTVGFGALSCGRSWRGRIIKWVPREVFIRDRKEGSALSALLDDASVAISVALQHGVPAAALAKSIGRVPVGHVAPGELDGWLESGGGDRAPASAIGAALDWLTELAGASPERRDGPGRTGPDGAGPRGGATGDTAAGKGS